MKLQDIQKDSKWIEKKPDTHTTKLQEVTVLNIRQHYETSNNPPYKQKNYTYIYYKTNEGTYYPARNNGYLDGLVGCYKVREFTRLFKPLEK